MKDTIKYPGLQSQPDYRANESKVVQRLRKFLRKQFGQPSGFVGNIIGGIMASRTSNRERVHWTLGLLEIKPEDAVLEIGFGPGYSVEQCARLNPKGFIAGVDHSDVMVQQATRRKAKLVKEGRVSLKVGNASEVPPFDRLFDKVFTINSIHFWSEPVECLKGLRAKMKPGALIAVTLQPRSLQATKELTKKTGEDVAEMLRQAGFSQVRVETKPLKPVSVSCALGINA